MFYEIVYAKTHRLPYEIIAYYPDGSVKVISRHATYADACSELFQK